MAIEYLEPDRHYIAKQLNGPIVAGFFNAVYNFFHSFMDRHSDYIKSLSIETANTAHLRFVGHIMGLQMFQLFTDPSGGMYLVFTEGAYSTEVEYDYNNGWAEVYRQYQNGDGVFGTGNEQEYPVTLTTSQYRAILEAVSQVASASIDSMFMIDLLAHVYLESTDYNISYNHGYTDVVNVVVGESLPQSRVVVLQHMYDRLLQGGTVTVLVTHV
jgi:hypothetical protein